MRPEHTAEMWRNGVADLPVGKLRPWTTRHGCLEIQRTGDDEYHLTAGWSITETFDHDQACQGCNYLRRIGSGAHDHAIAGPLTRDEALRLGGEWAAAIESGSGVK